MKESIGSVQIFVIVVILLLLFSGIMAFTINHSNAFAVKDEIVSVIEDAGGFDISTSFDATKSYEDYLNSSNEDKKSLAKIAEILDYNSYRAIGKCPDSESGYEVTAYQRDGKLALSNEKAAFCIVKVTSSSSSDSGSIDAYYYQIIVFYSLDFPVINDVLNLKAVGETKKLYR